MPEDGSFTFARNPSRQPQTKRAAVTGSPNSEIAYRCGFPDQRYFATLFRRETGESPRDCRISSRVAGMREEQIVAHLDCVKATGTDEPVKGRTFGFTCDADMPDEALFLQPRRRSAEPEAADLAAGPAECRVFHVFLSRRKATSRLPGRDARNRRWHA